MFFPGGREGDCCFKLDVNFLIEKDKVWKTFKSACMGEDIDITRVEITGLYSYDYIL